ncbi:MAG: Acetyltransferase family [Thermoleophilaceae bacterium]|nr:Acetyltransferase family [Thermoleophilaceae bacterium]
MRVRPAQQGDGAKVAELFYSTDPAVFDRLCGDGATARGVLESCFARPGTAASAEVVWVAELDGEAAGAMAAFPLGESTRRSRPFFRLLMLRTPPWRWPREWALRREAESAPAPPPGCFYVDSLATFPRVRRRGVATALLAEAERRAVALGIGRLAIDTGADNGPARAAYLRAGFRQTAESAPTKSLPGYVGFVKEIRR